MKRAILGMFMMATSFGVSSKANPYKKHSHKKHSHDKHTVCEFMPENKMRIPNTKANQRIPVIQLKRLEQKIIEIYGPLIQGMGGDLDFRFELENDVVNAYAQRTYENTWIVRILGGLIRHPAMTIDSVAMVACHELGHHLGGAPLKRRMKFSNGDSASNEGQSDYYAALICFKKLFRGEGMNFFNAPKLSKYVDDNCYDKFGDSEDYILCKRSNLAARELAEVLKRKGATVDFATPSQRVVETTFDNHPMAQCRLDTMFAGSLCNKEGPVSQRDPLVGTCNRSQNDDPVSVRPRCWYLPQI